MITLTWAGGDAPNLADELEAGRIASRTLVRFDLDGGSEGIWNDTYPLSYDGVTYYPSAVLLGDVGGNVGLSSERVDVEVSFLSSDVGSILDGIAWHQRPVVISKAFLDPAGDVFYVLPRFAGFLDNLRIQDEADGTARMLLSIESNNRELSRSTDRTRGDSDQRLVDADDGFFKHTSSSAVDSNIYWGRKGPQKVKK